MHLLQAARNGQENIVRQLLDRGADVNRRYRYGCTALMGAAEGGHENVVRLLLDRGADINLVNNYGSETALMVASEKRSMKI